MDGKELGDCPVNAWGEHGQILGGITLRQHYAGLAMAGALGGTPGSHLQPKQLALDSVAYADALLAALTEEAK